MQKSYRVSVKYKSGPLEGKFVVQVVNVPYNIGRELYEIWTETGFEVLIIPMDARKPNLRQLWRYKPRNRKEKKKLMNYVEIQNELDAATTAAIHAKTEEEREFLKGDVRYWENKKAEYMATHNVKGELLNA